MATHTHHSLNQFWAGVSNFKWEHVNSTYVAFVVVQHLQHVADCCSRRAKRPGRLQEPVPGHQYHTTPLVRSSALTAPSLPTDAVIRPAIVSAAATLDGLRDSLVRLLSPRLPRTAAVPAPELADAGCVYSSLVQLRPAAAALGAAPGGSPAEAASRLSRCLPGYVVDVRVGGPTESPASAAEAEECHRRTGKWLCRVACAETPADDGRRLAALVTSVLLSEEGAFHGQVLRL